MRSILPSSQAVPPLTARVTTVGCVSIYGFRRDVVCYVTRTTPRGAELLVFEHAGDDPANPSGVQVPAGGMLPFESLEDAAVREVAEETGLTGLTYIGQVGFRERSLGDPGGPGVSNFAHLSAPVGVPSKDSSWEHAVTGEGEDAGMTFRCRWEPLPLTLPLAGDQSAFVDELTTR
jgi:8-oxo-dGTP pyrophosphatase MutT (NUDIX family)